MVQKSGDHQLRLVVFPMIYNVLDISGGAGFQPSTVVFVLKVNEFRGFFWCIFQPHDLSEDSFFRWR